MLIVVDYGMTLSSALYFRREPTGCPQWRQVIEQEIFCSDWFDRWMAGDVSVRDVAAFLSTRLYMPPTAVEDHMRAGCKGLSLNPRVVAFVREQRERGHRTALVTGNIDLFTEVIVPDQGLWDLFDVIVNSYDCRTTDKTQLWPVAFERLDSAYGYRSSFLLEDSARNVRTFVELGGQAHRYVDDDELDTWLRTSPECPVRPSVPSQNKTSATR